MAGLYTISETTDPEGETFWVRHNRKHMTIVCAETGNGGSERFELGWTHRGLSDYDPICFCATRARALIIAKAELHSA